MESLKKLPFVKVYDGYGHSKNIIVYGHVFQHEPGVSLNYKKNGLLRNIWQLIKLFNVKPLAGLTLKLTFDDQTVTAETAYDGFFKLEVIPSHHLSAGWHPVKVYCLDKTGLELCSGDGKVFVPHLSQFAFISDIDDTIIRSFSASIFKRLYELISRNPAKRRLFDATAGHYYLLAHSFTEDEVPNPFFYVSSSEWNLYDYLKDVFRANRLPDGIFLLSQIKKLRDFIVTGRTGHEGKFFRIIRILKAFPKQQFVLLGDNSQKDPEIYAKIASLYSRQVKAIYIRNIRASKEEETLLLLQEHHEKGIAVCIFKESKEAIEHGMEIGLINRELILAKSEPL